MRVKERFIFRLGLLLLFTSFTSIMARGEFIVNGIWYSFYGYFDDNNNYIEDSTSVMVIDGPIYWDEVNHDYVSIDYKGDIVIPASITYNGNAYPVIRINDGAFTDDSITSIYIPNSVTSIGESAFSGCEGLSEINIPSSVTRIENGAFSRCTGLSEINLPNSITYIGNDAFYDCTGLSEFNIPNSITYIGGMAFNNTAWYDHQPNGLIYLGPFAYSYKGELPEGSHITLKADTKGICGGAFSAQYNLKSIDIPNSVQFIGHYAFSWCSGLNSINIPDSVAIIEDGAFNCTDYFDSFGNLNEISFGRNVLYIGTDAFSGHRDITSITCYAKIPPKVGINEFLGCGPFGTITGTWMEEKADLSVYENATLFVPQKSKEAYQTAEDWCRFRHIVGIYVPGDDGIVGDVNGDGEVTIADLNRIIHIICTGHAYLINYDVNSDGEVNIADANTIIDIILHY